MSLVSTSRSSAQVLSLLAASCGAPSCGPPQGASTAAAPAGAPGAEGAIVVDVERAWSLERAGEALADALRAAGMSGECGLAWGAVPTSPSFRRITLRLPEKLEGWVGCGEEMMAIWTPCREPGKKCNPALFDVLFVAYQDGKLVGMHPSDMGDTAEIDPTREMPEGYHHVFFVLPDAGAPAAPLLSKLRTVAPRLIVFMGLDVPPAAGPSAPSPSP